jgi:hypothetical protein
LYDQVLVLDDEIEPVYNPSQAHVTTGLAGEPIHPRAIVQTTTSASARPQRVDRVAEQRLSHS